MSRALKSVVPPVEYSGSSKFGRVILSGAVAGISFGEVTAKVADGGS